MKVANSDETKVSDFSYATGEEIKNEILNLLSKKSTSKGVISTKVLKNNIQVGFSPSKKICVICLIESPLKMIKNVFYFVLKAPVFKTFKFCSQHFGHVGKTAWLER